MVKLTEHAILLCQLAEYQDKLDKAAEEATIEYLTAQRVLEDKLQRMRNAVDMADAMRRSRKHIGGVK